MRRILNEKEIRLCYVMLVLSVLTTAIIFQMANGLYFENKRLPVADVNESFLYFVNRPAMIIIVICILIALYLLYFDKLKEKYNKAHAK